MPGRFRPAHGKDGPVPAVLRLRGRMPVRITRASQRWYGRVRMAVSHLKARYQ